MAEEIVDLVDLCQHFRFKKIPFDTTAGEELYRGKRYNQTKKILLELLKKGSMAAVLANHGSGKTVLMQDLMEDARKDGGLEIVQVEHPNWRKCSPMAVVHAFIDEFREENLEIRTHNNEQAYRDMKKILATHSRFRGKKLGIFVDEAHQHRAQFLQGMKVFSEMKYSVHTNLVGVLFFGWPKFEDRCAAYAQDIYDRLRAKKIIMLEKVFRSDMEAYLKHRAREAGRTGLFDDSALKALANISKTPLQANVHALEALEVAYRLGDDKVKGEYILSGKTLKELYAFIQDRYTQTEIAEMSGYNRTYVSDAINGKPTVPAAAVDGIGAFMKKEAMGVDQKRKVG